MGRMTAAELLETWLHELSNAMVPRGLHGTLLYDDKFRGDVLVFTLPTAQGLTELVAHRSGAGAVLIFVAENAAAAQTSSAALHGVHRQVSRRANSQRKFLHRIERMAEHVAETFDARSAAFPQAAFAAFQQLAPGAQPMVGVEALFHVKEHEEAAALEPSDQLSKRDLRKYVSRFAASIDVGARRRAVIFQGDRFTPMGETARALQPSTAQRGGSGVAVHASEMVVEGAELAGELVVEAAVESTWAAADATESVVEGFGEIAEGGSSCGDGGFDFVPDCDVCDVPDCSF